MSTLKLSATAASICVRSATPKTKPLFFTPNRRTTTIHDHRRTTTRTPPLSPNPLLGFTICKTPSSPENKKLLFLTRALSSAVPPQPHPQPTEPELEPSKLLTLPTILTLGRVAAVPLLVATFYMDGWRGTAATTSIFIAASVTDWLDGYIARKMKLKSSFGAFLDPVADKLMVAATLVLLCTRPLAVDVFGQAPWLLTIPSIAIIGREGTSQRVLHVIAKIMHLNCYGFLILLSAVVCSMITMSAVREWAASQDSKLLEAVAVNNLGKWKTASQMTAITILLATQDSSNGVAAIVAGSGVVLLYTSAGLAIWSLVIYMRKIWKVLLR